MKAFFKKAWGAAQSLISGWPPKEQRCPYFYFISIPFINRAHLMETKTTNYCANVSCGGLAFYAWFVFVFRPLCCFVLPPFPVSAFLASSCCSLILPYLHYITSYLNEACWEMGWGRDWTHTVHSKAEQHLTGSQVSLDFFSLIHILQFQLRHSSF